MWLFQKRRNMTITWLRIAISFDLNTDLLEWYWKETVLCIETLFI